MLQYERQQNILDILKKKHSASVSELAGLVYASEASVRRDIEKLQLSGKVERIYGGVILSDYKNEVVPVELRETANSKSKEKIALSAAELINDGYTVMLDSSSTARRICRHLNGKKNIRIITNNIRVLNDLKETDVSVYLTGGMFSSGRQCFIGSFAENFIKQVYADVFFFSANAISSRGEITDISEDEINLRRLMMHQAEQSYFLCDASKLNSVSPFKLCDKDDVNGIICDVPVTFEND